MKRVLFVCLLIPLLFVYTIPTTVMAKKERTAQQEMIFNILVDRYNNGDTLRAKNVNVDDPYAFHGGDLEGITKNLDDIEELGFSAISLSPIMQNSPDGYHGYWVEDFYKVDEHYGTMEDLEELIEEAHKRDIKVILEMVTNYVGGTNPILEENPDWISGQATDKDIPWMDDVDMLDQTNTSVKEFLFDVTDFWMTETEIDGFELHAADEANEGFLHDLTGHIKEKDSDFLLIADILYPENSIDYIMDEESIDLVKDYALYETVTAVLSKMDRPVEDMYTAWEENASDKGMLYVDNQYTKRFTQLVSENGRSPLTVWKLALTFMYTVPGAPYVYQGSTIPMYGEGFPENQNLVQFTMENDDFTEFYHRISSLRDKFPAMTKGDFQLVDSSGAMSVFKRQTEEETVFIAINNDSESQAVNVTGVDSGNQLRGILEDDIVRESDDGTFRISIPRESADVFIIEPDTGLNWTFIILIGGTLLLFPALIIAVSIKQRRQNRS
ncbi:MAG TPA: alpha-amylase family glycosyl hydrolase [Bacillota bacterium]|nr:alpha-amylase family glycosyl hydrolase [Bacillota bacterium]